MREISIKQKELPKSNSTSSEAAVQFKDNRPEATTQLKTQKIANNAPSSLKVAQLQSFANSNKTIVQRVKNGSEPIQFGKDDPKTPPTTVPLWSSSPFRSPIDMIKSQMDKTKEKSPRMHWDSMMQHVTDPKTGMPYNPMQQFTQKIAPMQGQFAERYPWMMPHLHSGHDSVVRSWKSGKDFAYSQVDSGMQWAGHKMLNVSRENFKATHYPEDGYRMMFGKYGYNASIDAGALLASPVINATAGFAYGVGDKMGASTWDRVHPRHAWSIMQHPDFMGHYLSQRKEQLIQPVRFYQDPRGFSNKKYGQVKNSLHNLHSHYSALDPGFMGSIAHGGRSVVDFAQDKIARGVGVGLASFMMYNTGKRKQRTIRAMDCTFPKDTFHGKVARVFPNRLLFAKPISRLRGNPAFSAALIAYLVATSMGKNREDMMALKHEDPDISKRLEENNSESYGAGTNRGLRESIHRTSKR
ncbi:MAG: hypothetical protein ACKVKQ_05890 [Flavobacteriales bacterium]|jgi:hypothetical protein|tara:strand:- start:4056 stop:5462 length:1407 start_codon:yes stop_codon:yes gene_type:complete